MRQGAEGFSEFPTSSQMEEAIFRVCVARKPWTDVFSATRGNRNGADSRPRPGLSFRRRHLIRRRETARRRRRLHERYVAMKRHSALSARYSRELRGGKKSSRQCEFRSFARGGFIEIAHSNERSGPAPKFLRREPHCWFYVSEIVGGMKEALRGNPPLEREVASFFPAFDRSPPCK